MAIHSKMEIEKFNGKIFELWKLNMDDMLVEIYHSIVVYLGISPTGRLEKVGSEGKEHNPTVSLRFIITECVIGRYNQGFKG
jgi:hypothetical protein